MNNKEAFWTMVLFIYLMCLVYNKIIDTYKIVDKPVYIDSPVKKNVNSLKVNFLIINPNLA